MKVDAIYRIVGGFFLIAFSCALLLVKFWGAPDVIGALSSQILLVVGCLAIALLGVLVAADGSSSLKKIRMTTVLIERMVREESHVITKEIAEAVGFHETEVRERVDEMIKERTVPAGTRITYIGGEKTVQ